MRENLLPRRIAEGHHCINPIPGHKVHTCRCGVSWNIQGLTYREWFEHGEPPIRRNG